MTVASPIPKFTSYQKFVVTVLVFLQFTIILDFMIISPLGAILIPALKITPSQFGLVVSIYAFSAGASGIMAAGFADRFDRKKLLLFFYTGFLVGTLACGLAPTYHILMAARLLTGLFGGVVGSVVFAIVTDLFSYHERGRVMGFLQTSFAASQILGIPIGLELSNRWGWHVPFLMIVGIGTAAGLVILFRLQPVREHLNLKVEHNAFRHLRTTVTTPRYVLAFAATGLMSIGGFMLMPFGSAFTVNNMKIALDKLPMLYFITGLFTMFCGPVVGRLADSFGKFKVFVFGGTVSIIMVVIYTNLGPTPLWLAVTVNSILFLGIFSRMIPSQALISAIPSPTDRGAFMAANSSLQQIAGGIASVIAGLIVVQAADGRLEHFDTLGYIMCGTVLITIYMIYIIHSRLAIWNRAK
jgi:predicted MFS family arabinose efflux permease